MSARPIERVLPRPLSLVPHQPTGRGRAACPARATDLHRATDSTPASRRATEHSGVAVPIRRSAGSRNRRRGWPTALAALSVPAYRMWLSSQVIATTGLWMQRIAQDWLVLEISGSVAAVGVAVALQFLPVLIFGLVGGVVVDRFPKRTLLLITQSSAALLAATLGLLALTGTAQVWQVYLVAMGLGLVTVIDNPTRQVFVAELVGDEHIGNAVSLNSSVFQFGALVGPALTGILISAVGQGWSFLINSAACVLVVIMVAVIKPGHVRPRSSARSQRGQLRAGLRYIRRTSEVAWAIVLVGTLGILGLNLPVILTAFADHEFGTGVGGYSLYNSANAAGAFLGAVLSTRRSAIPRIRMLVIFLIGFGAATAAVSSAPSQWVFAGGLVVSGSLTLLFLTGTNSLVQTSVPAELRGRVMSVYLLVLLGGQALGGPVVGWLTDQLGARPSMACCGAAIVLLGVSYAVRIARRAHLGLVLDVHHRQGRSPIRIVPNDPRPLGELPTR